MAKIYIAGKITGLDNYKEIFKQQEDKLISLGHSVMNPSILPDGFDYEDYMKICFAMIDSCEEVHFLDNWIDSAGARREFVYAEKTNKIAIFLYE